MRTQDFVCPECSRRVKAYVPQNWPPKRNGYYYPTEGEGILAHQGYGWVQPFAHHTPDGKDCRGRLHRYYVGGAAS